MNSFGVKTTLNVADWHALSMQAHARIADAGKELSRFQIFAPKALWLILVAAFVFMLNSQPPLIRPLGIAISLAGFFGTWWLQYFIQRRGYTPRPGGAFLGDQQFDFEIGGFRTKRAYSEGFNRWSMVTEITHTDNHVFLWIDVFSAYVVPVRDLPAPLTVTEAVTRLREMAAGAASNPSVESPSAPIDGQGGMVESPQPELAPIVLRPAVPPSVTQELFALLRLHCWGLVDGARLYGRDFTLVLLGLLSLTLWAGLDRLNYDGEVDLFIYGVTDSAMQVLAVLSIAWLLSRACRPRIGFRQGLLLVLGFLPIFVLMLWVAGWLPTVAIIVMTILVMAWGDIFLSAGLRSLTGRRQWLPVTATLMGVLALVYLSTHFYYSPGLWIERNSDVEKAAEARRENEQLVFEQSTRVDADIASLAPRVEGKPNVYFVGFAGYGGQKVFAEEIGLAAQRIGERYDAVQRSMLLVNDRRDSQKHPLATAPSLRHTLNALGQRMNVEEDVLVLALSSHGSESGSVSVSSELGYWRDLEATELAGMLHEAGIRWRVIVVSACYAGTFIEPLKDEDTIVITASAADRTSFGCSDDNDLTYFGEAFYRDALPNAVSLNAAFEAARVAIHERETNEGATPSNPQAHFGKAIGQKLTAMEASRTN